MFRQLYHYQKMVISNPPSLFMELIAQSVKAVPVTYEISYKVRMGDEPYPYLIIYVKPERIEV